MTLQSATLGPIRNTITRDPNAPSIVNSYSVLLTSVKEAGLLRRTRGFYVGLFSILVVALGGLTAGFIMIGASWFQLIIAAGLGILLTQFAFITHEASHRQVFDSGRANDLIGRFLAAGVVGISYAWWMTKHTRHHANPNTLGKDPDIEFDTIAFLEEDAAKQRGLMRWITQRQGYLFFPLLTLEGLNLHFLSIRTLFAKKVRIPGRALELSLIGVRLTAYLAVLFLMLPLGMAFAFLGVQLAVFGVYMGASFAPNHKGMPIIDKDAKVDFLSKQVLTSRNIRGRGMATFMGGLNYQIEHHLFPNMPRPHLARAREMVIAHCEAQNIKYTETTLMRSYGIVVQYLNRVGLAARDPFDCPEASRYRRP
jgi:fatty acid desaturase